MSNLWLINGVLLGTVALLVSGVRGAPIKARGAEHGRGYGHQKGDAGDLHHHQGVGWGHQLFGPETPPPPEPDPEPDPELDSDGDGLSDAAEMEQYGTDPGHPDTDGDLLSDGDEVLQLLTDPTLTDTDGGGVDDGIEVILFGTDPLNPADDPV